MLDVFFLKKKHSLISNVDSLKKYLIEKLSRIEIPSKIKAVKFIPKTSIGKNYRQSFI